MKNEDQITEGEIVEMASRKKQPLAERIKSISKGIGLGTLGIGYVGTSCFVGIFQIIFLAVVAIAMLGGAYELFSEGSWIWGLIVLSLTPIAVGVAHYAFYFWIFLAVISGAIYLVGMWLGYEMTFSSIMSRAWGVLWLGLGLWFALLIFLDLAKAIRNKAVGRFLQETWGMMILCLGFFVLAFFTWDDKPNPTSSYVEPGFLIAEDGLNAKEIDVYSTIIAKSSEEKLTDADFGSLRQLLESYLKRTGTSYGEEEVDIFDEVMLQTYNYNHELGESLLLSWNHGNYVETPEFDGAYNEMVEMGLRDKDLLEADIAALRYAAGHGKDLEVVFDDGYILSRETILSGIRDAETYYMNMQKLSAVFREFAKH
jgi:uncharacterized protein YheU (UPF0270 family)